MSSKFDDSIDSAKQKDSGANVEPEDQAVASSFDSNAKRSKPRRYWPIVLAIVLVAALALGAAGAFAWNASMLRDKTDHGEGIAPNAEKSAADDHLVNLLILGIDNDEGRTDHFLTDTIMVASLDLEEKSVSVLQIPRDTYIGTDLTLTGKINALYSSQEGYQGATGIQALSQYIDTNMSVPLDHYLTITMKGLRDAIDGIGGVLIDIPYPVDLDDVHLQAGEHVLTGNEAEKLVRQRHGKGYANGDVDRLKVQRLFMASLVKQLLQVDQAQLVALIPTIFGDFSTDFSLVDLTNLVSKMADVDSQGIGFYMTPGEYVRIQTQTEYGQQDVYSVHKQPFAELINAHFRSGLPPVSEGDLALQELENTVEYFDHAGGTVEEIIKAGEDHTGSAFDSSKAAS